MSEESPANTQVVAIFFFLMIRRPPRSTQSRSSAASDVYKRQPLYRVSTGKQTLYAQSEKEREAAIKKLNAKNISVQRFKGLGEMNADQLWETTMNPQTRTLLRAEIEDGVEADAIFTMLMGEKVAPRKSFIMSEARKVQNLDI